MHTKLQLTLRLLLLILGGSLVLNGMIAAIFSDLHTGTALTLLLGTVTLLSGIFFDLLLLKIPNVFLITFFAGVAAVLLFSSFLFAFGRQDTLTYQEDVMVVLGSSIRGEQVSKNLQRRLDAAIAYHAKNPDALIIVTGGKGAQESISEALAMERYLISKGIFQSLIIKEDQAASTGGNFRYTKALLEEGCSIAFITTDFHVYRANTLAQIAGFSDVTHGHSKSVWYTVIPNCLRECLAMVKAWVVGK